MDSKAKPNLRLGEVEVPETRLDASSVQRVSRWLIGAVVVLAVGLVAVGTWAIVDRSNVDEAPRRPLTQIALADPATFDMIDALLAARTGEEYASFFTEDGVLDARTDEVATYQGRESIARAMQGAFDLGWYAHRLGSVARWDDLAAHALAGPPGESPLGKRDFHGMAIYELTPDGQVSHMWLFGDYRA